MKTLKFECELLTDVILNQKSASEGQNKTLDFIPGSCFLGIVAAEYKVYESKNQAMEVFHSGRVRFGDAHLEKNDCRSIKIPASLFYPKLQKMTDRCYVHHCIPDLNDEQLRKEQLKQCRSGFFCYDESLNQLVKVDSTTNFAIKSAYDRVQRRAKDSQMFGYESLQKGMKFLFEVEVDNESLAEDITRHLEGDRRIGRSRTAQYGLVHIKCKDYAEVPTMEVKDNTMAVYADSRLVFFDEYGLPTFMPTAADLGLEGGEVLWEKSQIRTFQYAPWNYQRQCYDTDRCGIEKGSVLVVDVSGCGQPLTVSSCRVGYYRNEGFGKVIYNPRFLDAKADGLATCAIVEEKETPNDDAQMELGGTALLDYVNSQCQAEKMERHIYEIVNEWVRNHCEKFKGERFASQWGTIRTLAMQYGEKKDLSKALFDKTKKNNKGEEVPDAYLTHGVAADKWKERGRLDAFKKFFEELKDCEAQWAVINLASEMAKKCRKD